jgi:hypothetical protein
VVLPFVISGTVGQFSLSGVAGVGSFHGEAVSSATLRACSTTCLSRDDCVGVFREPCGVKVGDTASSNIQVTCSTLCSRERDKVDWIVDKSSRRSPTRSGRRSVIVAIYSDRVEGWVRIMSKCFCRFRSV